MFTPFAFYSKDAEAPPAAFVPTDISELLAWYDFTDSNQVNLVSGEVDSVTDQSDNNITANYVTARPLYKSSGGLNDLGFMYNDQNATDQYLQGASNWPTSSFQQTGIFVGYLGDASYDSVVHSTKYPNDVPMIIADTTTPNNINGAAAIVDNGSSAPYGASFGPVPTNGVADTGATPGSGSFQIVIVHGADGASQDYNTEFWSGRWIEGPSRTSRSALTGASPIRFLRGNSFRSNGGISEYFAYGKQLSADEIEDVKGYLVDKYDPQGYVTQGLRCYVDANKTTSYPGSGSTWFDLSGFGRDLTLDASPTFVAASGGTPAHFDFTDGTDAAQYKPGGTLDSLTTQGSDYTVCMFFAYHNSTSNYRTIFRDANGSSATDFFIVNTGTNNLGVYSDTGGAGFQGLGVNISTDIPNYTTQFNYQVYQNQKSDGTTKALFYLNAASGSALGTSSYPLQQDGPALFGNQQTGGQPGAKISAILVYNRILTTEEIGANYEHFKTVMGL